MVEDCQKTSLPAEAFDTAFMSLVIHFTDPEKTVAEVRRLLKPGGILIISNLDLGALRGLDLIRCRIRVIHSHSSNGFNGKCRSRRSDFLSVKLLQRRQHG
jgi:SAM-dependent methyltransferase